MLKWLSVLATIISTSGAKALFISPILKCFSLVEVSASHVDGFPQPFLFILHPLYVSYHFHYDFYNPVVNFSWHIFSALTFISYSTVTVSFNAVLFDIHLLFLLTIIRTLITFSHFISWSTVLLSKISKFCFFWKS